MKESQPISRKRRWKNRREMKPMSKKHHGMRLESF
jgi:hypothetical protein